MSVTMTSRHPETVKPDSTWSGILETATHEVFEMMVGQGLERGLNPDVSSVTGVTAMVGMAGRLSGILSLRCSREPAVRVASCMLGPEIEGTDEHVRDAMGEICNMVAGNFKSKIGNLADTCMLTVPTVICGSDYQFHPMVDGERLEICLGFSGFPLWVTLHLPK